MAIHTSTSKGKPPYRITGLHVRTELWELLTRIVFERRKRGAPASVSAPIGELIDGHKNQLGKEFSAATR